MPKQKIIYLAGLISTAYPETHTWRLIAQDALQEHATVLSPLRGKSDLFEKSKDGGITDPNLSSGDVILRDYGDIQQADIMLVNLESYGSTRPMVGTIAELAWAWERRIPIVAIASSSNKLMRTHPFIVSMVTRFFDNLDDGIDHVLVYYLSAPVREKVWVN
jgi:nucleoside 2-deoxyribosyltransferase